MKPYLSITRFILAVQVDADWFRPSGQPPKLPRGCQIFGGEGGFVTVNGKRADEGDWIIMDAAGRASIVPDEVFAYHWRPDRETSDV